MKQLRTLLLASACLLPMAARAQVPGVPTISFTGLSGAPAVKGDAIKLSEIYGNFAKVATAFQTSQTEALNTLNPGIASTYFGLPSYPQPNLSRLYGHLQAIANTGPWGSATDLLTVVANCAYGNDGNQGSFWDPTYRYAYGGQDAGAGFLRICGRVPVVANAPVSFFGSTSVATPQGARTVYFALLSTALTPAQITAVNNLPPGVRVEAAVPQTAAQIAAGTPQQVYFGYTIPPGQKNSSGTAVLPVSADGLAVVVDNWVCDTCSPSVQSSAGASPPSNALVTVDVTHLIDDVYGQFDVEAGTSITGANNLEFANVNNLPGTLPALNLYDPLTNSVVFMGMFSGVVGNPGTMAAGTAQVMCTGGWQACFVARNQTTSATGATIGFLAPYAGPAIAIFSAQGSGYLEIADPGDSCQQAGQVCQRTVLRDVEGNETLAGTVMAAGLHSTGSVTSDAILLANDGAQLIGTVSFRPTATSQTGYIDPVAGDIQMRGAIGPGVQYINPTAAELPLHGCNAGFQGNMIFIGDAPKPGESKPGTGALSVCEILSAGGAWVWARTSDNVQVYP